MGLASTMSRSPARTQVASGSSNTPAAVAAGNGMHASGAGTGAGAGAGASDSVADGGVESTSGTRQVCVAYHDEYGLWGDLAPQFRVHLPLHHLNWCVGACVVVGVNVRMSMPGRDACCAARRSSRNKTAEHTIDTLDVQFLPSSHETVRTSVMAVDLYKAPYGYIYIVACEGLDEYKNVVKPRLKTWAAKATERQWQWMVVYLPRGAKSPRFPVKEKVYQRVLDRLKSDFGGSKKDAPLKCVRVDLFPDTPNSNIVVQWRDLAKVGWQ